MSPSWLDSMRRRSSGEYSPLEKRPMFARVGANRAKLLLPVAGLVALAIIFFTFSGQEATQNATSYFSHSIADVAKTATSGSTYKTTTTTSPSKNAGLLRHVLTPADKSNADVCKFVLSATINGYETITLYNWHKTGNKMAKISGGLEYMEALDPSQDDELLLIADGFDEWFQLPVSIMEARFHEINRKENERILTRTGKPYQQNIIISTQRQCWPGDGTDVSCYTAPESPLPAFVFGHQTDNMVEGWNTYAHLRPRYMNAGYTMGTVKAMRELWTRAEERSEANPNQTGLDQNVLATIWGEQNYMREYERFNGEPIDTPLDNSDLSKRDFPNSKPNKPRKAFKHKNGTNYEFGIGLDYGMELSLPTVFAEYDAEWLTFSNQTSLDSAFDAQNVTNPGASRLQSDIAALPAPFANLVAKAGDVWRKEESSAMSKLQEAASTTTWEDIGLFTNMWTGITPAIIHHNAWRDDLKSRRESTWQNMWFQPYARQLLDAWVVTQPKTPSLKTRASAKFRSYLGGRAETPTRELGVHTDNENEGNWVNWKDLCSEKAQDEIFRDGKGPWVGNGGKEEGEVRKASLYPAHNEPSR